MIIGITGTNGAGKGTVVEILKEQGFAHYSAGQFITNEVIKRNLPVNRDSMITVANDLREKHGSSYVVEELYKLALQNKGDAIIESIRNVGEINSLKKKGNFRLLAVDATEQVRYERITKRQSEKDDVSFEEFLVQEKKEMTSNDSNKQNVGACMKLADFVITNDGNIEELKEQVNAFISKFT